MNSQSPGTILGLLLGSLETQSHPDVGAAERHRKYYMGEGGGFPRVRAVVNLVSPGLPVVGPKLGLNQANNRIV